MAANCPSERQCQVRRATVPPPTTVRLSVGRPASSCFQVASTPPGIHRATSSPPASRSMRTAHSPLPREAYVTPLTPPTPSPTTSLPPPPPPPPPARPSPASGGPPPCFPPPPGGPRASSGTPPPHPPASRPLPAPAHPAPAPPCPTRSPPPPAPRPPGSGRHGRCRRRTPLASVARPRRRPVVVSVRWAGWLATSAQQRHTRSATRHHRSLPHAPPAPARPG